MLDSVATNEVLAEMLGRQGILPKEIIDTLLQRAAGRETWLGKVAVEDGLLTDVELARAIADGAQVSEFDLGEARPDFAALRCLDEEACRTYSVVPVALEGNVLRVAAANPLAPELATTLAGLSGCQIVLHVAPIRAIVRAIDGWCASAAAAPVEKDERSVSSSDSASGEPANSAPDEEAELALDDLLITMMKRRASDLHITVGSTPLIRVDGELEAVPSSPLRPQHTQNLIYPILTDTQISHFERHWELDLAYSLPGVGRFRVNVFRQRGSMGAIFRSIPTEVPTLDHLNMPPVVKELTNLPRGLVLVTGPTGSGKSTTLAAMINEINRTRRCHIVTIEDPIEFLHRHQKSEINQREVGADTESFTAALRHVLRQDPDVILIGEMRDLETISAAITAAETGHLVFATLHTTDAAQTIDRIIDVFPPDQQEQIRNQLSTVLEAILSQTLMPKLDGRGRCCAQEILIATSAVRNLIREGKIHQMASVLQAGSKVGMQTLDQALRALVTEGKVALEEAASKSSTPEDFRRLVAAP